MKSTITLLTITVLAAFALAGCNQSTSVNPTDAQSTNSSASDTNDMTGEITNNTNLPATTNQ
jgi:hypothetical protein